MESFKPAVLQEVRRQAPDLATALDVSTQVRPADIRAVTRIAVVKYTVVTRSYVSSLHAAGLTVYTYTPNTAEQWAAVRSAGVDAVLTNYARKDVARCATI